MKWDYKNFSFSVSEASLIVPFSIFARKDRLEDQAQKIVSEIQYKTMNTYTDEILTVGVFLFQLHAKKSILLFGEYKECFLRYP
jgi:hypothetical protein